MIEDIKRGNAKQPNIEPEQGFVEVRSASFMEREQAFGGAYRSYRVNGSPKVDVDTFFS